MLAGLAIVGLVAAAIGGWLLLTPTPERANDRDVSFQVVEVQRRDLTVGTSLQGQLGFGAEEPIPIQASGTVTWLPALGARAELGDVLLKVDNRPIVLMYGSTPAFRAMDDGTNQDDVEEDPAESPTGPVDTGPVNSRSSPASADDAGKSGGRRKAQGGEEEEAPPAQPSVGPDVEELESGLSALGYTGFTVDEEFTSATAAAVKRWQEDLGVEPTGRVELGDVVFLPGPIRLRPSADSLGRPVSETSVYQTGLRKVVTVETDDADWAEKGVSVKVTLPSQKSAAGHVVAVTSGGSDPETGSSGMKQIRFELNRPRSKAAPGPVTVTYASAERKNVLVVPVAALVALSEGGYGVELAEGGYVGVEPGLYADGLVEITGDLDEGTRIRVPS